MPTLAQFNALQQGIPFYFLIAYKRNSQDTCRGCLMASFESDFESHGPLTRGELVTHLTTLDIQAINGARGEASHLIQIHRNGIPVFDSIYSGSSSTGYLDTVYNVLGNETVNDNALPEAEQLDLQLRAEMVDILEEVKELVKEGQVGIEKAKERVAEQKREAEETAQKARDYQLFLTLKEQFEPKNG